MKSTTALRIAVVAEWVLILVCLFLEFALESSLPKHLQEYLVWQAEQDVSILELVALLASLPLLLASFVSSVVSCS